MEFVIILIALAVERWTPVGGLVKRFQLLERYLAFFSIIFKKIKMPTWLNLMIMLIPLLVFISVFYYFLSSFWWGAFYFLFSLIVLLYCLGTFDVQSQSIASVSYPTEEEKLIVHLIVQSNRNIFAVLFWFAMLGPVGAVLYRFIEMVTRSEIDAPYVGRLPKIILQLLDWVPVRLIGFGCALVSHFLEVMAVLLKEFFSRLNNNEHLLAQCGLIALEHGQGGHVSSLNDIQELSIALVDRTLVLWLVIMALIILL